MADKSHSKYQGLPSPLFVLSICSSVLTEWTIHTQYAVNHIQRQTSKILSIKGFHHLYLYHYIFIISYLWLTSHPRSTVVLLDTGTPGTSGEIYNEDADGDTRTRNPSVISRVLKSYCWEGTEFIQLVYCIII